MIIERHIGLSIDVLKIYISPSIVMPIQQVGIFSLPEGYKGNVAHNSLCMYFQFTVHYTQLCVNNVEVVKFAHVQMCLQK